MTGNRESTQLRASDPHWRTRHLVPLLGAVVAVMVVAAVVGGAVAGPTGALGAALGVAVAAASFTISTLVIAYADQVDRKLIMPLGMGVYVTKIAVLSGVLLLVAQAGWAGLQPFAWGMVAGIVVWTAAQIWWIVRVHVPATQPR